MSKIIDDKSQHCIPFILDRLRSHKLRHANNPNPPPFFLGLNGVQGAGKTVLVKTLTQTLQNPPNTTTNTNTTTKANTKPIPTLSFSLDDIYLTHTAQKTLSQKTHPHNPLLAHRGQPGTHDVTLGRRVFDALKRNELVRIPRYDKAAFGGEGERVDVSRWGLVNGDGDGEGGDGKGDGDGKIEIVIFEGWCVGFRAWDERTLRGLWEDAVRKREEKEEKEKKASETETGTKTADGEDTYNGRLGYVRFDDVRTVNEALRGYDVLTDALDALIHIDAHDLHYVYEWRQEQERSLRAATGSGMSEEQVDRFVDGYYPSYELFTQTLREGVFKPSSDWSGRSDWQGRQLRLVVDRNRRVTEVVTI